MIELVIGALVGLWSAQQMGVDGTGALVVGAGGALLAYLAGCAMFPIRRCWWCKSKPFITDGRGNMREKPCIRCGRKRTIRRPGARLIGARGRRE